MRFEENKSVEKLGTIAGFIFSYLLFTTVLFFIYSTLGRLHSWGYLQISGITLLIVVLGIVIKRSLQ